MDWQSESDEFDLLFPTCHRGWTLQFRLDLRIRRWNLLVFVRSRQLDQNVPHK